MVIDSVLLGSLYMNFTLLKITAAPTPSSHLEASVYIFSLVMFCIQTKNTIKSKSAVCKNAKWKLMH